MGSLGAERSAAAERARGALANDPKWLHPAVS